MTTQKSRSSLVSHIFPPFYACYLLKSIRTARSTATYIGSTPHPPRRIRQHNGEISQGAWKTKHNRPWIMQMIVYGFPSKLAALQFEWAWQHPHLSRHLKAVFGGHRRSKTLNINIKIVQAMIATHPYNLWPLHVKLFTKEAVKGWDAAQTSREHDMPMGFTYATELEGVDGKSGEVGSGRQGPIDVTDELFSTAHLTKHAAILATNQIPTCTVCQKSIDNYSTDPLGNALCPNSDCTAVSHLLCLSQDFLLASKKIEGSNLLSRGGHCKSCRSYILWGDVIRGCYRRSAGGLIKGDPSDEAEEAEDIPFVPDSDDDAVLRTSSRRNQTQKGKRRRVVRQDEGQSEGSGEYFDLAAIHSSDEDESGSSSSGAPPLAKSARRDVFISPAEAAGGSGASRAVKPSRRNYQTAATSRPYPSDKGSEIDKPSPIMSAFGDGRIFQLTSPKTGSGPSHSFRDVGNPPSFQRTVSPERSSSSYETIRPSTDTMDNSCDTAVLCGVGRQRRLANLDKEVQPSCESVTHPSGAIRREVNVPLSRYHPSLSDAKGTFIEQTMFNKHTLDSDDDATGLIRTLSRMTVSSRPRSNLFQAIKKDLKPESRVVEVIELSD